MIVFLAIGLFLLLITLVAFFVIRQAVAQTGSTAPGWQVRCLTCGRTRPAGEVGIVRIGAVGTKYTLGRCSQCGKTRRIAIEPIPTESGSSVPKAEAKREAASSSEDVEGTSW